MEEGMVRKEVREVGLEEYVIRKLDARVDCLERELRELSVRLKKAEERLYSIDDDYVNGTWFDKVLVKLHPEVEDDGWYESI